MTEHKPKTAALEALARDLLSDDGARRIRKHLRDCEICQTHFGAIQVYRDSQEIIATTTPDVRWSKIEVALAQEARSQSLASRSGAAANERPATRAMPWLVGGAIAVAAGVVAAILLPRVFPSSPAAPTPVAVHEPARTIEEPSVPDRAPTYVSGVVSMIAGAARFVPASTEGTLASLAVGQRVAHGTLSTEALAQAHLLLERPLGEVSAIEGAPTGATSAVARVALGPSSRLVIGEAAVASAAPGTVSEIEARLEAGRTTIDAFETNARVIVLASAYRVEIRAARCTIELTDVTEDGATARVSVGAADPAVGEVVVVGPDGARHALAGPDLADAPRTWSSRGEPAQLDELPQASSEGAVLQVSYPEAIRFEIDGQVIEGGPMLAMRVSPGIVSLRAFDAAGRAYRAEVSVGADGLALAPDDLEPVRARVQGYLAPEDITPVVQQSQRALQRCYEQAMRLRPDLQGGAVRARVTLDSRGTVRLVRVAGEHGDAPELEACVRQEAARWVFPSPGGPMSFDLPLRFHARQ